MELLKSAATPCSGDTGRLRIAHEMPSSPATHVSVVSVAWLGACRSLAACWRPAARPSSAVAGPAAQFELSDTVQLDRADSAVLAQLERVKACLADRQWDEAIETSAR